MLCDKCKAELPGIASRLRRVNDALASLPTYHASLGSGLVWVYDILRREGFTEPEVGYSLPTNEGRIHAEVGSGKWLTVTWYKMPSGTVEIVAYVN